MADRTSSAATTLRRWVVEFVCGHRWSSEWHPDMDEPARCPVCGESEIAYAEAATWPLPLRVFRQAERWEW